jgi:hypothetical protein
VNLHAAALCGGNLAGMQALMLNCLRRPHEEGKRARSQDRARTTARRRRSGRLLLALALALTLILGGVEASPAATHGLKAMWGPSVRNGVSVFPTFKNLGVKIYQDDLHWNSIARRRPSHPRSPSDPAYRWPAEVTSAVAQAKRYGMQVALEIIGTPGWANGNKTPRWVPHSLQDYANFAVAAARRYPSVHLWMIWGEPSRSHNFRPLTPARPFAVLNHNQKIAPHLYARLLDSAYGALKAVSSANLVIGGMTDAAASVSTPQWIENMRLPDGSPPRLDLYGHNPFSIRLPNLANPPSPAQQVDFSDLGRLTELVNRNLGRPGNLQPGLFLSEWTIPTAVDREFNFYVDPRVQAQWITAGLRIARQLPSIYAVGWIHLYDELPGSAGGLIRANGKKKPGYFAWRSG